MLKIKINLYKNFGCCQFNHRVCSVFQLQTMGEQLLSPRLGIRATGAIECALQSLWKTL